ncbi:MAG TPA: DNA mismatch repair protein [Polyangiaceae bacterium]|nr:DNA mismatch repair protein [Polyangiaceae bacterium]
MITEEHALVPDLLHPIARSRIDREHTRVALVLAFAGGASGGLFADALEKAEGSPSSWDPATFARDLFLGRFVAEAFRARIGADEPQMCVNHLVRLLSQPPRDLAVVHYRRQILTELCESSELRSNLEQLYRALCRLRGLLESAAGQSIDPSRRQLDTLVVIQKIIDLMATGFGASTSGLRALAAFGTRVQGIEPYQALSDLVRYDAHLATLSLNVGVGADGRIRGFEVVSIRENSENPFVNSVWRRWAAKLELFLRGYRFSDGEVMARLIDAVFTGVEDEVVRFVQLLGEIEFYLGALGFRDRARAAGLEVCLPALVDARAPRRLEGLFNPLLLMSGITPVPCTIATRTLSGTVLITGPNSGGKTRLLQALAFAQVLAQAGLFIPARSASIAVVPSLVVSLIEETKADQTEGRLGMELMRIRALFERLPPGAMVLLDELCSGTNPSEGEEIFELVVSTLARLEPQVFITTHFLAFAARLQREGKIAGLGFLQVELGADRRATFQFVEGVAKTSLAGHAAERLGVTRDQLDSLVERNTQLYRAGAASSAGTR